MNETFSYLHIRRLHVACTCEAIRAQTGNALFCPVCDDSCLVMCIKLSLSAPQRETDTCAETRYASLAARLIPGLVHMCLFHAGVRTD